MQIASRIYATEAAAIAALKTASPLFVSTDKESGADRLSPSGMPSDRQRFDIVLTPLTEPVEGTIPGPKLPDGSDGPPLKAPDRRTGEFQVDLYWRGDDAPALAGGRAAAAPTTEFAPPVPAPAPFDADAVFAECKRRIFAVASTNAQVNMAAARAAGILSSDDEAAFLAGLQWIAAMRETCAALISAQDEAATEDGKWPTCPPAVVALAAKF